MFGILGSLEGTEKEGEKKEKKKKKNVHLANRRAGWLVDVEESCGLVCARVDRGRLRARVIFW